MEIYLIRHTTPDIQKGICYGQTDLDTTGTFEEEASCIKGLLPGDMDLVFSSPLKRCSKLASYLFPSKPIQFDDRLKEIHCGAWEMQLWDEIEKEALQKWMDDFVNICIPGGESYHMLYRRVVEFFEALPQEGRIAVVSHGGVLRSLLSHITGTGLKDSFNQFGIRYGCVIRISREEETIQYTVLHNPLSEKEQHKPSRY